MILLRHVLSSSSVVGVIGGVVCFLVNGVFTSLSPVMKFLKINSFHNDHAASEGYLIVGTSS